MHHDGVAHRQLQAGQQRHGQLGDLALVVQDQVLRVAILGHRLALELQFAGIGDVEGGLTELAVWAMNGAVVVGVVVELLAELRRTRYVDGVD